MIFANFIENWRIVKTLTILRCGNGMIKLIYHHSGFKDTRIVTITVYLNHIRIQELIKFFEQRNSYFACISTSLFSAMEIQFSNNKWCVSFIDYLNNGDLHVFELNEEEVKKTVNFLKQKEV